MVARRERYGHPAPNAMRFSDSNFKQLKKTNVRYLAARCARAKAGTLCL
jgi:hypothetical protein